MSVVMSLGKAYKRFSGNGRGRICPGACTIHQFAGSFKAHEPFTKPFSSNLPSATLPYLSNSPTLCEDSRKLFGLKRQELERTSTRTYSVRSRAHST
ncbi:hypothetical protein M0804_006407 [Polistes exclamans]|nr:hypothetical protein M0804_006407 [Polistes exclamans]